MWLKARGIPYDGQGGRWMRAFEKLSEREQFRFRQHFNRRVESCLDRGLGECYLRQLECVNVIRAKLFENDGDGFNVGDFILMPNHVHVLIIPSGDELEMILKSLKGPSALECNRLLGRRGSFWQADSYDHIARSLEQLSRLREYIARNPRMAGINVPPAAYYRAAWMDEWS